MQKVIQECVSVSFFMTFVILSMAFKPTASASPGSLLEMQGLRLPLWPTESEF